MPEPMIPQPTIDLLWPSICTQDLLFDFGVNHACNVRHSKQLHRQGTSCWSPAAFLYR